jgi:hypothetical protein
MNGYTYRRIKQIAYQVMIDIEVWMDRDKLPF